MEITLEIPRNKYTQPTEPRPEVIQYIINAFLENKFGSYRIFHSVNDGYPRYKDIYIKISEARGKQWFYFANSAGKESNSRYIRFYGCEMKAAMAALIKAGWHILEVYEYRTWKGYICCEKPYYDGYSCGSREIQAEQFTDFID